MMQRTPMRTKHMFIIGLHQSLRARFRANITKTCLFKYIEFFYTSSVMGWGVGVYTCMDIIYFYRLRITSKRNDP